MSTSAILFARGSDLHLQGAFIDDNSVVDLSAVTVMVIDVHPESLVGVIGASIGGNQVLIDALWGSTWPPGTGPLVRFRLRFSNGVATPPIVLDLL